MKLEEIILQKKAPCGKCPYKLGLVETLTNPCPQCKQDGYSSYEWFLKIGYGIPYHAPLQRYILDIE